MKRVKIPFSNLNQFKSIIASKFNVFRGALSDLKKKVQKYPGRYINYAMLTFLIIFNIILVFLDLILRTINAITLYRFLLVFWVSFCLVLSYISDQYKDLIKDMSKVLDNAGDSIEIFMRSNSKSEAIAELKKRGFIEIQVEKNLIPFDRKVNKSIIN